MLMESCADLFDAQQTGAKLCSAAYSRAREQQYQFGRINFFSHKKNRERLLRLTKKPKKPKRIDSHVGKHHQSFGRGARSITLADGIIIFTIPT